VTDPQNLPLRPLYPELTPYASAFLDIPAIDDLSAHQVYFECCGNPEGIPVIYLHGGPGSACRPQHRRYFNPDKYHIILFDQRGCGRSLPLGELSRNTTQDLIHDMETIRQKLGIDKWLIFGGSWGSTLGICYSREHSSHVLAMVLRGVFLGRQQDIEWVYNKDGAAQLFPSQWQSLMHCLNPIQQMAPLSAFMSALQSTEPEQRLAMATALNDWQSAIGRLEQQNKSAMLIDEAQLMAHFKIQLHYALNQCFISDRPLLSDLDALRLLPTWLIQGQYDLVCPTQQSWALHQALPHSKLRMIHLAGHAANEDSVVDALVSTTDEIAAQFASLTTLFAK